MVWPVGSGQGEQLERGRIEGWMRIAHLSGNQQYARLSLPVSPRASSILLIQIPCITHPDGS